MFGTLPDEPGDIKHERATCTQQCRLRTYRLRTCQICLPSFYYARSPEEKSGQQRERIESYISRSPTVPMVWWDTRHQLHARGSWTDVVVISSLACAVQPGKTVRPCCTVVEHFFCMLSYYVPPNGAPCSVGFPQPSRSIDSSDLVFLSGVLYGQSKQVSTRILYLVVSCG